MLGPSTAVAVNAAPAPAAAPLNVHSNVMGGCGSVADAERFTRLSAVTAGGSPWIVKSAGPVASSVQRTVFVIETLPASSVAYTLTS